MDTRAAGGVAVWVYQAVPMLTGNHVYYNAYTPTAPWDPSTWPGWWKGFDRILPQFDLPGHPLGAPSWALLVELALAAVVLIAAWEYMRPGAFANWSLVTMAVLVVVAVRGPGRGRAAAPTTALTYDATQLGAPVIGGTGGRTSPDVQLQGVLPSTYRLTLAYSLTGATPTGSIVVSCNAADGSVTTSVRTVLEADRQTAAATVHCTQTGTVASQLGAGPGSGARVSARSASQRTGP